jgi:hypothetical protein
MSTAAVNHEVELALDLAKLSFKPAKFASYNFPWGERGLEDAKGLRTWQREILETIGQHLCSKETRFKPLRLAVASGHGIGKSSLISMVINWAMSTCEDCKCIVTASTGMQLFTKTQPEIAKWFRLARNSHWWDVHTHSVRIKDPAHQATWRTDLVTWAQNNPEAFQGLHNLGKRIVVIFDEASGIDDPIWAAVQGALTDENTQIIWIAFGNPTRNTGRFRECFGRFAHDWVTKQIDSRTVDGTNKEEIAGWIRNYGEDSDFVRVKVRGEFPRAGSGQFIPSDIVSDARAYKAQGYESLPKVLSCDVARFGDDQTVFGLRQGRKFKLLEKLRGKDTVFVAERLIHWQKAEEVNATVVDGDGIGGGVIDAVKHRGFGARLFDFHGGHAANDAAQFFNRRAEMWGAMRDWLVAGAEIPDDPELADDLTNPEYYFSPKQQIQIEKKDEMKSRGLRSPDCGDCLMMSFSVTVAPPKPKETPRYRSPGENANSWMLS